ncbi:hypothetical protein DYI20_06890 [Auritidibacter ignavus]|nr:hypothetical protein [Auritidibacter ignavus]RMX22951.1 hypothetical protein DYI20_06890 [Auritidibacter ignavus]
MLAHPTEVPLAVGSNHRYECAQHKIREEPLLHNQPMRSNQLNLPAGGKDGPINRRETDQGVDAVINEPRL